MSKFKDRDIKELYGSPIDGGGSDFPSTDTVYEDAMSKALKEQNYKAYLNTAIQQYNMKNNTNKYLNNELASRGVNTQGYGSSAHAYANNQAINLYSQNMQNYQNNNLEADNQALLRKETQDTEKDNMLVTFINEAGGNQEAINKYMQNFGYMDEKGNYTGAWNNMNPNNKAYIQSVIDNSQSPNNSGLGMVFNYDDEANLPAYDKNGNQISSSSWNKEYAQLNRALTYGDLQPDTYIKFKNNKNQEMYLYYSKDGNIYYVNKNNWETKVNAGAKSVTYKTDK